MRDLKKKAAYNRKYRLTHKESQQVYRRAYRSAHREEAKIYQRNYVQRKYPPSRPRPTCCECCGKRSESLLCLDHWYDTDTFRGWICQACNTGIGKLGDSIEGVKRALDYLIKNR